MKGARLLAQAVLSTIVGGAFSKRLRRRVDLSVTVDGRRWEPTNWLTVAIGTVDNIGLQFRPFPQVVGHPGHLEIVGISGTLGDLAKALPAIRLARPLNSPAFHTTLAREVVLEAQEPMGFMVDGDFHSAGQRLEIRPGPRITFTWA